MKKEWIDRCVAQRVPVLHSQPLTDHHIVAGQVLLKDNLGGIAPLGSFEFCDRKGLCTVFPAQSLNTTAKTQTLAASMGLCSLWEGHGLLSLHFIHQSDGPDFALMDVREGRTPESDMLLAYRGFEAGELLSELEAGATIARLGAIPGLMRILACSRGKRAEGYSVREALEVLGDALPDIEDLRPWFAAGLRGDSDAC